MNRVKTLKMNYEFKNVFSRGKYCIGKQVIVYILENKYDYNRIGIAISFKLCNAVIRNRVKRLIRASYQKFKLDNGKKYDIVFVWNKNEKVTNASLDLISKDLHRAFVKFGMIK